MEYDNGLISNIRLPKMDFLENSKTLWNILEYSLYECIIDKTFIFII